MIVRYRGESTLSLTAGECYEVLSVEGGWYRIVDQTEDDYLFPPGLFEVVVPDDGTVPKSEQSSFSPFAECGRKSQLLTMPGHNLSDGNAKITKC